MSAEPHTFLTSRESFQAFVAAWESGTLPKSRFTHAAHVAIGAYYTVLFPNEAFQRIKTGIIHFNESAGGVNNETAGYHETLTLFWCMLIAKAVRSCSDPWDAACQAVEKFGQQSGLHRLYYSFDVVQNTTARKSWIPPDLDGPY